jgi:hypothetical protein
MSQQLHSLIKIVDTDADEIYSIINSSDFKLSPCGFTLDNNNIQSFLKLLTILDNSNINACTSIGAYINKCFNASHYLMSEQLARDFVGTIKQLTNIIISIEKLLCRFYNHNTIINIITIVDYFIDYDVIFFELVTEYFDNTKLLEYVISNNCVNYNEFDYSVISGRNYGHEYIINILLSHGFDIVRYPIGKDIYKYLKYVSLQNLKYFSSVKLDIDEYIIILSALKRNKLEEFLKYYNTQNIVYTKEKTSYSDRTQLLINSGVNIECIIGSLLKFANRYANSPY